MVLEGALICILNRRREMRTIGKGMGALVQMVKMLFPKNPSSELLCCAIS